MLPGDRSVMSTVADVAVTVLADFFCLQQIHPIITRKETASVKADSSVASLFIDVTRKDQKAFCFHASKKKNVD